jgi:hypothetical protein
MSKLEKRPVAVGFRSVNGDRRYIYPYDDPESRSEGRHGVLYISRFSLTDCAKIGMRCSESQNP